MEREIKFRSWDGERMIYFSDMSIGLKKGKRISPYVYFAKDNFENRVSLSKHVIMQFTGMKDKQGNDIYEGDIIKYQSFYEGDYFEPEGIGYVDWDEQGHHIIKDNKKTGEAEYLCSTWDISKNYGGEVIGNIYEHKNLLK